MGGQANINSDNTNSNGDLEQGDDKEHENKMKVSSLILRSSSIVFDRMLSANMKEKEESKIVIHAQRIADVDDLYYFMCTNILRSTANSLTLIHLAKYYEMDGLFDKVVNKLIKSVSIGNFAKAIRIFDRYEIVKGYDLLIDFAKKNADELKKSPNFDAIPHSFKCAVLTFNEK